MLGVLPPTLRKGCSTGVGYDAHTYNNEKPCENCIEGRRLYRAQEHLKNREKRLAKFREYHSKNKETILARKVIYNRENPEVGRVLHRKRKARLRNAPSEPYTTQQILDLYGTDCHLCHEPIDLDAPRVQGRQGWERGLNLEHVIPISRGGTNMINNVKPSHALCNMKKHAKVIYDYSV